MFRQYHRKLCTAICFYLDRRTGARTYRSASLCCAHYGSDLGACSEATLPKRSLHSEQDAMIRVLNVAEKPSVAKEVSRILSNGRAQRRQSACVLKLE